MSGYKQFNYDERVKLAQLMQLQSSITEIASALGRSRSTIYRELKRNEAPPGQYWPDTAEALACKRRQRLMRLDRDENLRDFVLTQLQCHYWTPEQIAGWLKHRQKDLSSISHESIYAWIYQKRRREEKLWKFLPRHKATRGLRKRKGTGMSRIPNRVSIHERPKIVDRKKAFGHWEADLMAFMKNSQYMAVLRERKTMYLFSSPLESKRALDTSEALRGFMKSLPKAARKTITYDNGGEFALHNQINAELGMRSFFCDPYASWQKGGIENTNARLRRDLPRKTDVKNMNPEEFDEIILNYNTTPRKSLGWLTPLEAFNQNLNRVALHT